MKEIKPNQPRPSQELLEKVQRIAFRKSMVSLAYRGEFNKFGVYVQSKKIYEQDVTKTIYMTGGKFIPKLKFTEIAKDLPLEFPLYTGIGRKICGSGLPIKWCNIFMCCSLN